MGADHIVWQLIVSDGCEERVTHCTQPRWALWLENTLKLSQLFGGLKQLAEGQSSLMLGFLCGFKEAGPLLSLSGDDLHTRSGDEHGCWHVWSQELCSLQGKSSGLRKKSVNATSRCRTRDFPWVLMSVTQNQGGRTPENAFLCVHEWVCATPWEVTPLCRSGFPLPRLLVENVRGEGSPCHHHPGLVMQWGREWIPLTYGFKWNKPSFPICHMPHRKGEVWLCHRCPGWPSQGNVCSPHVTVFPLLKHSEKWSREFGQTSTPELYMSELTCQM